MLLYHISENKVIYYLNTFHMQKPFFKTMLQHTMHCPYFQRTLFITRMASFNQNALEKNAIRNILINVKKGFIFVMLYRISLFHRICGLPIKKRRTASGGIYFKFNLHWKQWTRTFEFSISSNIALSLKWGWFLISCITSTLNFFYKQLVYKQLYSIL